jgi:hypothetical protein
MMLENLSKDTLSKSFNSLYEISTKYLAQR